MVWTVIDDDYDHDDGTSDDDEHHIIIVIIIIIYIQYNLIELRPHQDNLREGISITDGRDDPQLHQSLLHSS